MNIRVIEDISTIERDSFNCFQEEHPNGNFFQSLEAFTYFASIDGYKPVIILATEAGEIVGSLLAIIMKEKSKVKGYLSRRCIIYSGPIIKNDDAEITKQVLRYFDKAIGKKVIYAEFRAFFDMESYKEEFGNSGYNFEEHLNFIVPISSEEDNKRLLNASKRRQLSLSLKNGAEIIEPRNLSDIESFYSILKELYQNKVKKPIPGFDFFEKFYNNKELGSFFLIKYEDKIIGGIMCPVDKNKIYEWFICGLDGQFKNIYPSVMATWAPIEFAANNGIKYFDFLGAGKPDTDYGVREFKSKFGGELVNYGRFVKIYNKQLYSLGKLGLEIIGKIRK